MSESDPFSNGLYAGVDPQWQTDPAMLNGSYDKPEAPAAEPEGDDAPPPIEPLTSEADDTLSAPPALTGESELAESFDPGKGTVDEVNAYLADASEAERDRVLALELEGKGRSGILSGPYAPPAGE